MAYQNKRDRANVIQKARIEIGNYLGCESPEEAIIVVREPDEMEVLRWREAQQEGIIKGAECLKNLLADLIIDHNLMEDEKESMKVPDVVELIFEKTELCDFVVNKWTETVFPSRLKNKEGK